MPKMTGAELARAAANERPGLPIIIATGYAELPKGEGGELRKLQKPFDLCSLEREISKTIALRASWRFVCAYDLRRGCRRVFILLGLCRFRLRPARRIPARSGGDNFETGTEARALRCGPARLRLPAPRSRVQGLECRAYR